MVKGRFGDWAPEHRDRDIEPTIFKELSMKPFLLCVAFLSLPTLASADTQTLRFSVTTADRDLGLFLVAAPSDCAQTRYLVLGAGVQAVSEPLSPGESVVLPLGRNLAVGAHEVQVQAMGCSAGVETARLVTLGQASPGHGRAQPLVLVDVIETAGN
jgi:hypothetical protein